MNAINRFVLLASISLFPAFPAICQTISEKAAKDHVVFMADEDPAMRKAFEKARSTLNEFFQIALVKKANLADFAVKVGIKEGSDTEYFWIVNFKDDSGTLTGEIANEPRMVKNIRLWQTYTFKRSDIVDWTYRDTSTNRLRGNFTLCALLTKEPKSEAKQMRGQYRIDCSFVSN